MTDKVTGLCAPATVLKQRNVKGYIFQHAKHNMYYLEPMKGYTKAREQAHVYSYQEAKAAGQEIVGWGCKQSGKWVVVYE